MSSSGIGIWYYARTRSMNGGEETLTPECLSSFLTETRAKKHWKQFKVYFKKIHIRILLQHPILFIIVQILEKIMGEKTLIKPRKYLDFLWVQSFLCFCCCCSSILCWCLGSTRRYRTRRSLQSKQNVKCWHETNESWKYIGNKHVTWMLTFKRRNLFFLLSFSFRKRYVSGNVRMFCCKYASEYKIIKKLCQKTFKTCN